jgi:hypothetical protein
VRVLKDDSKPEVFALWALDRPLADIIISQSTIAAAATVLVPKEKPDYCRREGHPTAIPVKMPLEAVRRVVTTGYLMPPPDESGFSDAFLT